MLRQCGRNILTLFMILSTKELKKSMTKIPQIMLPTPNTRVKTEKKIDGTIRFDLLAQHYTGACFLMMF